MVLLSTLLLLALAAANSSSPPQCPSGATQVDAFTGDDGNAWFACEDLQRPGGAIVLVSSAGDAEHFAKTYEQYGSVAPGTDADYYLNLTKQAAVAAHSDVLGQALLAGGDITWQRVASAVPPIRRAGVRAVVGSRGSVSDTTFNDAGEDANQYGFPPALSYVFNLTTMAERGTPLDGKQPYINGSLMAAGLVGGHLPIVVFYYPVTGKYLDQGRARYWTMVASGDPDMKGSHEQTVWFRFQQIQCSGPQMQAPCAQVGTPQYWDTYWWSRAPGNGAINATGPATAATASGFYASLLKNRRWWDAELEAEGMMQLSLPSPASTNGTWLMNQMRHQIIQGMITWHDTWGPRYVDEKRGEDGITFLFCVLCMYFCMCGV